MKILAHRGRTSPGMPGNTIDDLQDAAWLGVDFVETDICLTKDRVPIIYHPGSTYPDCSLYTWQELISLRKKLPPFITWEEIFYFQRIYPDIKICIDIKKHSFDLIDWIVSKIINQDLQEKIYLTTFQKRSSMLGLEAGGELLIYAKKINPDIKTHIIATFPFNLSAIADKYNPNAISFGWLPNRRISRLLFDIIQMYPATNLKNQIEELKNLNIDVWSGIVNNLEDMRYFANLGVNGIMTDDAILGMKFKEEYENPALENKQRP